MQTVKICRGCPGSGKSTWALDYAQNHVNTVILNNDTIRLNLGYKNNWSPEKEKNVKKTFYERLKFNLDAGMDVIADNTYLNPKTLGHLQNYLKSNYLNVTQEIKDFTDVHVNECIARDKKRTDPVGYQVIWDMYVKHLMPRPGSNVDPNIGAQCIICDLDGTLAEIGDRNPYDASTCEQDGVNPVVDDILYYAGVSVFYFSGRSNKYREQTIAFLNKTKDNSRRGPWYMYLNDQLIMRSECDPQTSDWIIKKQMYDDHIAGKYNVFFAIDDRPQVIRLWKSLGIRVLNVGHLVEF